MKLKDTSGVWVNESAQIKSMFVDEFTAWFKLDQAGPPNVQIDVIILVIADDNETLLALIRDLKIKKAVFQMDKFSAPRPNGFGAVFFFSISLASYQSRNLQCDKILSLRRQASQTN